MDLHARDIAQGTTLETDVCIVGAGPAGITLAHELIGSGLDVVLLESGDFTADLSVQALNQGSVVGDAYVGLDTTRWRGMGGTSGLWNTPVAGDMGAKFVPLDPVDLEDRAWMPLSGWPFAYSELEAPYVRAQAICGLGPFDYGASRWARPGLAPLGLDGPALTTGVYQLGMRSAFPLRQLAALQRSPGVRVCQRSTVVGLDTEAADRRVAAARLAHPSGGVWHVRAERFVLAAGAIENARLMLVSGSSGGLGNAAGWVGRCFMEHPRDRALRLIPADPRLYREAAFYDLHEGPGGTWILGRIALRDGVTRRGDVPNASATLLPLVRPGFEAVRRRLEVARGAWRLARFLPTGGHGWTRFPRPQSWFQGLAVLLNVEQAPFAENRVVLADDVDALGVPRPRLHWRWSAEEQAGLERLRELVAGELEGNGLGRVLWNPAERPDPHAHHHAGTTRMHRDPTLGVVDPDCRVNGVENLFAAGASVFPTAGYANPLLTIVALSARLADHLAGQH